MSRPESQSAPSQGVGSAWGGFSSGEGVIFTLRCLCLWTLGPENRVQLSF